MLLSTPKCTIEIQSLSQRVADGIWISALTPETTRTVLPRVGAHLKPKAHQESCSYIGTGVKEHPLELLLKPPAATKRRHNKIITCARAVQRNFPWLLLAITGTVLKHRLQSWPHSLLV